MDNQMTNGDMVPEPVKSPLYIAGYLNQHLGKLVKIEFLVGNTITDRTGVLAGVGVNYVLIRPIDANGVLLGDLYSIKFITIVDRPAVSIFGGMGPLPNPNIPNMM
jgi:hypothetical protein